MQSIHIQVRGLMNVKLATSLKLIRYYRKHKIVCKAKAFYLVLFFFVAGKLRENFGFYWSKAYTSYVDLVPGYSMKLNCT